MTAGRNEERKGEEMRIKEREIKTKQGRIEREKGLTVIENDVNCQEKLYD